MLCYPLQKAPWLKKESALNPTHKKHLAVSDGIIVVVRIQAYFFSQNRPVVIVRANCYHCIGSIVLEFGNLFLHLEVMKNLSYFGYHNFGAFGSF